jgi:hypothetical protein
MVIFKLEMILANNKLFYTEKKIIPINLTPLNYFKYSLLKINLKHYKKPKYTNYTISTTINIFQAFILIVLLVLDG